MYVQLFLLLYILIISENIKKVNNNHVPVFAILYHSAQTKRNPSPVKLSEEELNLYGNMSVYRVYS